MAPKHMSLRSLTAEVGGLTSDAVMSGVVRLSARRIAEDDGSVNPLDAGEPRQREGRSRPEVSVHASRADGFSRALARAARPAHRLSRTGGEVAGQFINSVASRFNPNVVLDRVDVQRIVDRVDVQSVLDRVDIDQVVGRIDVDRVVDSLDPNRVVSRIDVDAVVERIDVADVTADALDAIDIGEVIRESTSTLGSDAIEGFRYQAMVADGLVARTVDRLLTRSAPRRKALEHPDR